MCPPMTSGSAASSQDSLSGSRVWSRISRPEGPYRRPSDRSRGGEVIARYRRAVALIASDTHVKVVVVSAVVLYDAGAAPDILRYEVQENGLRLFWVRAPVWMTCCLMRLRMAVVEDPLDEAGRQHLPDHDPHRFDVDLIGRDVAQSIGVTFPPVPYSPTSTSRPVRWEAWPGRGPPPRLEMSPTARGPHPAPMPVLPRLQ